ncbi:MAG: ElyC/SanA/YdcF family protein [Flavobacteriales bacterium]
MSSIKDRAVRLARRCWFRVLTALLILVLSAWIFRIPIMQAASDFLVMHEGIVPVDAVYVLGGASLERGMRAAVIHRSEPAVPFYFTGSNIHTELEAHGIMKDESDMGVHVAVRAGVPSSLCIPLHLGTSTMEEADAILIHCGMMRYDTIAVLSSNYHMRRIDHVFTDRFARAGIVVRKIGAPTDRFDEHHWWYTEEGLMAVNNEYMKLLYYWWKY